MSRKINPSNVTVDVSVLADRLHSAAIHLLRRLRREDEKTGISPARLSALSVIVFGGPLSLGALASAEQVKPPTMSRIVTGLEAQGLVRRGGDERDGRAVVIRATPKGKKLLEMGRARRIGTLVERLRHLETEQLESLDKAVAALGDLFGGPPA